MKATLLQRCALLMLCVVASAACRREPPAPASAAPEVVVRAQEYDAFWLWAGVRPQPVLAQARLVYLLQGEVLQRAPDRVFSRRPAVPRIAHAEVWIVYRIETTRFGPAVVPTMLADIARWRRAGNRVVGVQIDFDAKTRHLDAYAAFLASLRKQLPADLKLGITGLLDWSANGDPQHLDALAGVVDEAVLQIYQGRQVIPGYANYLRRLDSLRLPFKIGLLQDGPWRAPAGLATNPTFRGYVVFLVNPRVPAPAAAATD